MNKKIAVAIIVGIIYIVFLALIFGLSRNAHAWYHPIPSWNPSPTASPTVSPEPTQSPQPTEQPCFEFKGEFPEPCPTASPTPEQTAPPAVSTTDGPVGAPNPSCNAPIDAPKLTGFKVEGSDSVTFSWWPSTSTNVDSESIIYGYTQDQLIYGVNNLDKSTTSFTIKGLAGFPVWAKVGAWSEGCVVWSNPLDP
jgi:hypothetical protein